MEAGKSKRQSAGHEQQLLDGARARQGPFLKAFLKTDRVWDDAAKKVWADDVERRLREVRLQIDPRPMVHGYVIYRFQNSVAVSTVSPSKINKQEMAALSRGEWPCWDEILKAVPEFIHSQVRFDFCTRFEWGRKWDVESEMSRLRLEHGVFE